MQTFQIKTYKIHGLSQQDSRITCVIERTDSVPEIHVTFVFVDSARILAPSHNSKITPKGTLHTDVTVYIERYEYPWYVDLLRNEPHVYIDTDPPGFSTITLRSEYRDPDGEDHLWGLADLHTHPASHLAFGGMFWGDPGRQYSENQGLAWSNLANDLQSCDAHDHGGFGLNVLSLPTAFFWGTIGLTTIAPAVTPVVPLPPGISGTGMGIATGVAQDEIQAALISAIEGGDYHGTYGCGWPTFEKWPHALSKLHQQMHIQFIHRAFLGGLRLMIASVTDNQLLSAFYALDVAHLNRPDSIDEMVSARNQLDFIRMIAQNNTSWMEVVETPAQARSAIRSNKLAIILSVEMDSLNANQIISLRQRGVRHAIPIHLANNSFGGTALYGPKEIPGLFNLNNLYLNHESLQPQSDPTLRFRLCPPKIDGLTQESSNYDASNHPTVGGHKNVLGLRGDKDEIRLLMKEGFLIDLAHMSETAQNDALTLAEEYDYPVMNSHTGLRSEGAVADSERLMLDTHARRMAKLGGIMGLGTEGSADTNADQISRWVDQYLEAFRVMHGEGVALGTDFNGFAPQIPSSRKAVKYPIREIADLSSRMTGPKLDPLPQYFIGTKTYDFSQDGLAHYGMIPDFIAAVAQDSRMKGVALMQLFRTAEATIEMWEKVEAAAKSIP